MVLEAKTNGHPFHATSEEYRTSEEKKRKELLKDPRVKAIVDHAAGLIDSSALKWLHVNEIGQGKQVSATYDTHTDGKPGTITIPLGGVSPDGRVFVNQTQLLPSEPVTPRRDIHFLPQ
jgi:hypothetical protein